MSGEFFIRYQLYNILMYDGMVVEEIYVNNGVKYVQKMVYLFDVFDSPH